MARFTLNDVDYTSSLVSFLVRCRDCGSHNVTLDVEGHGVLDETYECIRVVCHQCGREEKIHERY